MHVYLRAAAVARINRRVGLNPGACFAELADGADDSFDHAELHGAAGIADGENAFALADGLGIGERQVRKVFAGNFYQRDVEVFVDVNNFAFQMLAVGQNGDQRTFIAGDVGVGGDHAGLSDEEAAAYSGLSFVKIATAIVFFQGRSANGYAVDFRFCVGRSAGDTKFFGVRGAGEKKQKRLTRLTRVAEGRGASANSFIGWK